MALNRMERQSHYICVCGDGFTNFQFAIQCDSCKEWFHGKCVQIEEYQAEEIEKFFCRKCRPPFGLSVAKLVTNSHRHNRTELNASNKPTQSGTIDFIDWIRNKKFFDAKTNDSVVRKMRGQQLTFKELLLNGFNVPVLVESKDGLELSVPNKDSFDLRSILDYFSADYVLDVIDVKRQLNIKMKTKDFVNHLMTDPHERQNVYNCISLEVSQSQMSDIVRPPSIVNKLSWVESYWPKVESRPAVSKYCLISMENSYTDFHIDFGGTSVWYHVLKGEKVFYIIKPTEENIAIYEKWMASHNSSEKFLPDLCDQCFQLNLIAGQTLFIPTGWIHAVLTPQDSIVFGGNFLHSLNIQLQIQIREMEQRIKTPDKFQFPFFELTHWYAAPNVLKLLQDSLKQTPPKHLVTGVEALSPQLKLWLKKSNENQNEYQSFTLAPRGFNCSKLIKDLNLTLKKALRKIEGQPLVKKRGKSYKSFNLEPTGLTPMSSVLNTAKPNEQRSVDKKADELDLDLEEQSLVVDDSRKTVTKKLRTSSTESESKGSLKLKLSMSGTIVKDSEESKPCVEYNFEEPMNDWSNNTEQQIPLFPLLKSASNQDSNIESPKKKQKNSKKKRKAVDCQLEDEIESMVKGRPEDDDYIYLDLETPDEESLNKDKTKDESWNPKAKCNIKSRPKPPRPTRDGAKREVVETSIANAAAKIESMPQLKRPYNKAKKNVKLAKTQKVSAESVDLKQSSSCEMTSLSVANISSAIDSSQSTTKPSINANQISNKKPKKGEATAKQRIAKKMKLNIKHK